MVVAACLLLEYGVSAAAVAVGWSQYLNEMLDNLFGFTIPENLSNAPEQDGVLNLPAVVLILMCMFLLIRGASESAKVNAVMVLIKIGVLVLFIVVGATGWDSDNLSDFSPFGVDGITSAAGIIFFSYIGLDAVSTAGEEVHNPRRNLPLAIIIALITVTTIYILVALVAVAAQQLGDFEGQEAGLSAILESVTGSSWPATVLAAGAVISIFSVTLVVIYGQTRILFAMSRDGMIPRFFHRLNPRTLTPVPATVGRPARDVPRPPRPLGSRRADRDRRAARREPDRRRVFGVRRPRARVAGQRDGADDLVVAAAGVTARAGATLRVASFAVRARAPYTAGVGSSADEAMLAQWAEEISAEVRAALERVEELPVAPAALEAVIGQGESWEEALEDVEWDDGDVLVVGSSSIGPVARVFLGSRATKIVRHSLVPVVLVPRRAAAELAEEAVHGAG
jgi:nucleotide-binding universal stress UspA family protein